MTIKSFTGISLDDTAADIVKKDYRAASVFKRHGIEFCCGARFPLKMVLDTMELDPEMIKTELQQACRTIRVPNSLPFENWTIDFLADYIIHVHHQYLKQSLPLLQEQMEKFIAEHVKKYPHLSELGMHVNIMCKTMPPHLQQEEEIIFPYLRQIAHAYESRESYAGLLVRTLRKPVKELMHQEHESVGKALQHFRTMTNNYTPPENACTSHRLSYSMLQELDEDLVQHLYLENGVLFPRAIAMENELLQRPL